MIIFFGKGEFESDALIKDCLNRYLKLSQCVNLQNANQTQKGESEINSLSQCQTLQQFNVKNVVISRVGKPHFENLDLKFSLSHSHGVFVLAFSKFEVGLDIEFVRELNFEKFSRLFNSDSAECFFRRWTKCEALGKYLGSGASFVMGGAKVVAKKVRNFESQGGVFTEIPLISGYTATTASMPQEIILVKYDYKS